jgi:hypothetical protein
MATSFRNESAGSGAGDGPRDRSARADGQLPMRADHPWSQLQETSYAPSQLVATKTRMGGLHSIASSSLNIAYSLIDI